jgi:hypothetical protein
MGLLDDAIREHLELKRMRGADPGEVTREEQEALGPPVYADDTAADAPPDAYLADADQVAGADAAHALATDDPFDQLLEDDAFEDEDDQLPAGRPGDLVADVSGDQETAEVDMQAMLDSEDLDEDDDLEHEFPEDDDPEGEDLDDEDDPDDDDLAWDEPSAGPREELD